MRILIFREGFALKKSGNQICRVFAILSLFALLLSGCGRYNPADTQPQCRVVTGISVIFNNGPIHAEKYYTSSNKMRAVLNYLRWIDPYGPPEEDPETVTGSSFRITLEYSDGCQKDYVQKADRFMQEDDGSWKKIDPKKALTLSQIIGLMESD